jgi:hypothetical protein
LSEPQKSAGSSHQGTEQLRGIRIMRGTAARHPKGCSNRGLRHTSICREAAWSNHWQYAHLGRFSFVPLNFCCHIAAIDELN